MPKKAREIGKQKSKKSKDWRVRLCGGSGFQKESSRVLKILENPTASRGSREFTGFHLHLLGLRWAKSRDSHRRNAIER